MSEIKAVLWDIGGVLLTNGWDHKQRAAVVGHFGLDLEEFESRHPDPNDAWERDQLTLDEYLGCTVFYTPRTFLPSAFIEQMKVQSQMLPGGAWNVLCEVAQTGRYLQAAVNNEARELNDYRIEQFGLRKHLQAFFSSCYVGLRKPESRIFRLVLDVLRLKPEEVVFVDDRESNARAASQLGMHGLQFTEEAKLKAELIQLGVLTA